MKDFKYDIWERLHWVATWTWEVARNISKLTKSIDENSKSSDNLAKVWHMLTWVIIILWFIQVWIEIFKIFN